MEQHECSASRVSVRPRNDLTGKRFGKLQVIEYVKFENGNSKWKCRCDCGNVTYKTTGHLNSGAVSCGCSWRQPAVKAGQRFGKLVAMEPTEKRSNRSVIWKCQCDCGEQVEVRATMLTSSHTTSCGCAKRAIDDERDFKKVLTYIEDTCIEFVQNIGKQRSGSSSQTGVRGVILKDGKYLAQINYKKKRYYLGRYLRLEDAVKARKQAEARIEEYVEAYLSGTPLPETFSL